ncbi:hypothetical protein DFJ77DRAFT_512766 [Powellomyces hirtus]|nr:hypothetical protein DFJ77DRAFT_512766 [Powellomyces hirtus]
MTVPTRLFVGKLNRATTDESLRAHFPGSTDAGVMRGTEGKSKQHGFVVFATEAQAEAAMVTLNDSLLDDRNISVKLAVPPKPPAPKGTGKKASAAFPFHKTTNALVDIGANLTSKSLLPHLSQTLAHSATANVTNIIITGTSLKSTREALKLCREHHKQSPHSVALYATAGIHPHEATHQMEQSGGDITVWVKQLESLIQANLDVVRAVGECGLDYDRKFSTHADQIVVFEQQLALAEKFSMPVFLHNRDAHDDFLKSLKKYPTVKGVVHCYTDPDPTHVTAYLELGFTIGITGWLCDERRGVELAEKIVPLIPLDRLMIETDAPYLMPRNITGGKKPKCNEPALLGWVCKKVAECYHVDEEVIARATTENARKLFGLPVDDNPVDQNATTV